MKPLKLATSLVGILLLGTSVHLSWAQPETNPTTINAKPLTPEETKVAQQKAMEEAMKKGQEEAIKMMNKTPAEQKAALHEMMEKQMLVVLNQAGFKDEKIQKSILAFVASQEVAREKVRQEAVKVYLAVQKQGKGLADGEMSILLSNYLNSVEDAKEQREQATQALDGEIGFSKKPSLEAMLTLLGMIGDASAYSSDLQMAGMMNIGNIFLGVDPKAIR
jgi:hypothetical protein